MKKKYIGYLKLYRYVAIEYKKPLTDQEYRLFDVYVVHARWDKRDTERFGIVENLSLQDIRDECLPKWSRAKISAVRKSLAEKGFITLLPKNKTGVNNFWIYQSPVRQAEQGFRCMEQQIPPTEQNIQQNEQKDRDDLKDQVNNLVDKYRVIGL